VLIAAITSCTNTSNPSVMLGAGLLARKAVAKRSHLQAVGQDQPGTRLACRHRLFHQGRLPSATWRRWDSTSWDTAALPVSVTPAVESRKFPPR